MMVVFGIWAVSGAGQGQCGHGPTLLLPPLCPTQTLCALIRGVHQKNKSTSGFDIINMLMGFDKAELCMKVRCTEGPAGRLLRAQSRAVRD